MIINGLIILITLIDNIAGEEQLQTPSFYQQTKSNLIQEKQLFWTQDDLDFDDYYWTIKDLESLNTEDLSDCDDIIQYFNTAKAWKIFFSNSTSFIVMSRSDLKSKNDSINEIMETRASLIEQIENLDNSTQDLPPLLGGSSDQESDLQEIESEDIYEKQNNNDKKKGKLHKNKNHKQRQKKQDSDMVSMLQIGSLVMDQKEFYRVQKQLNGLHSVLETKEIHFKGIFTKQGPTGGGETVQELYEEIQSIINHLYDEYGGLEEILFQDEKLVEWEEIQQQKFAKLEELYDDNSC